MERVPLIRETIEIDSENVTYEIMHSRSAGTVLHVFTESTEEKTIIGLNDYLISKHFDFKFSFHINFTSDYQLAKQYNEDYIKWTCNDEFMKNYRNSIFAYMAFKYDPDGLKVLALSDGKGNLVKTLKEFYGVSDRKPIQMPMTEKEKHLKTNKIKIEPKIKGDMEPKNGGWNVIFKKGDEVLYEKFFISIKEATLHFAEKQTEYYYYSLSRL